MSDRKPCSYCGRVHAAMRTRTTVLSANSNFSVVPKLRSKPSITAEEALIRAKERFKGTLAHLS